MLSSKLSGPIQQLNARRAYFIFNVHFKKCREQGMKWPVDTVAEMGVGTSFGVGLCFLLSGAKKFIGVDAFDSLDHDLNKAVFSELVELFRARAGSIDDSGAQAHAFPGDILTDEVLKATLSKEAVAVLDNDLETLSKGGRPARIAYLAPYELDYLDYSTSADLIVSTATFEHVEPLPLGHRVCWEILRPGGYISHSIDFKSHGFAKPTSDGSRPWNGHWQLSGAEWRRYTKGKNFSLNRAPASLQVKIMIEQGFEILEIQRRVMDNGITWRELSDEFKWFPADDIKCSGLHVIARRPANIGFSG